MVKKPSQPAPAQIIPAKNEQKPNNGFKRPPDIRINDSNKVNGLPRKNQSNNRNRIGQFNNRYNSIGNKPIDIEKLSHQNGSNSNPNSRRNSNSSNGDGVGHSTNTRRRNSMKPACN